MILTAIIIIILMGCWIHGRRMGLIGLVITTVAYFLAWLMTRLGARFVGAALAGILPSITDSTNSTVTSLLKTSTSEFFYSGVSFMLIFWRSHFSPAGCCTALTGSARFRWSGRLTAGPAGR